MIRLPALSRPVSLPAGGLPSLTPAAVALWAAVLGGLGIAAAVLWPREPLPGPRSIVAQEAAWQVPAVARLEADAAIGSIVQRPLWALAPVGMPGLPGLPGAPGGLPAMNNEPPLTPPDWRIVGTVIDGRQRALLVAFAAPPPSLPPGMAPPGPQPPVPPQMLRVGDRLPGGARIQEIRPDGVRLLLNGRKVFLSTIPQ